MAEGHLRDSMDWTKNPNGDRANSSRRPIGADYCTKTGLLAVLHRGQDIFLWDLDRDTSYATYNQHAGARALLGRRGYDPGAVAIAFSQEDMVGLLAAA